MAGKHDVEERCGCGKQWFGEARTNPSLKCDVCYPPKGFGYGSYQACVGCSTLVEHFDACIVGDQEREPREEMSLGEIGLEPDYSP